MESDARYAWVGLAVVTLMRGLERWAFTGSMAATSRT
jgi:hypothetical protein